MAVVRVKPSGGELPSVSARMLPANAARVAKNLQAQVDEFRPLKTDSVVASTTSGNKTLYRMSRDGSGNFNDNPASNWISNASIVNYARGQIDDDRTERTYYSYLDGSQAPRVKTATGVDRALGVPAPDKPVCTKNDGNELTLDDAIAWGRVTLVPAIRDAIIARLTPFNDASRINAGVLTAGPYSYTDRGFAWSATTQSGSNDSWNLRYNVGSAAAARDAGLDDPLIQPEVVSGNVVLRLTAVPAWGSCDGVGLKADILTVNHPREPGPLFSDALAQTAANRVRDIFDPSGETLKTQRDRLDAILTEFKNQIDYLLTTVPAVLTEPTVPSTPEITYDVNGDAVYSTAPEWVAYRADLIAYKASVQAHDDALTKATAEKGARITKIAALQTEAAAITKEIEAKWVSLYANIEAAVTQYVVDRNLDFNEDDLNVTNMLTIDPDRIMEDRFYVMTFVNDWGEESAPGPVSDLLEVSQYNTVTIAKPASVPGGYGIVGWRLYRTNQGSSTATFQLVADSSAAIAYNTNGVFDYFKTVTAELGYTDDRKGSELQETLSTTEWLMPPTSTVGASTFQIAGFTALPNGIMAGFLDRTICFCEPYMPYAWPIAYQLTVHSPVVGMAAFGQTLVVCTKGAPYLANGTDSATMNLQELPGNQACVSASSIVSTDTGVLYASPDGICMVSLNGVQVVTQGLFTREDWQALNPSSIVAALHDGCYYFAVGSTCYALDFVAKKLIEVLLTGTPTALYADKTTDTLYALIGGSITALFGGATPRTGFYRTGIIQLPRQQPMAWLQVDSDFSSSVIVRWFGDDSGTPKYTATVTSVTPVRLPPGRYLEHEIEIETTARVTGVTLAGSTQELQSA